MLGIDFKGLLKWAMGLVSIILRSPLINFCEPIPASDLIDLIGRIAKDGYLTDEETADLIDKLKEYIK